MKTTPKIKIYCPKCEQSHLRNATCGDCQHLKYMVAPDCWMCTKGRTGNRLCKEFKNK